MKEAKPWEDGQSIIWYQLGTKYYGLDQPNRGQIIKEFLAEQCIAAAKTIELLSNHPGLLGGPKNGFQEG